MKCYYVIDTRPPKLEWTRGTSCAACSCVHNKLNAANRCYGVVNKNTSFGKKCKIYRISVEELNSSDPINMV